MIALTFTGAKEMQRNLQRIAARFPEQIEGALRAEMEIEATECKRRTPVDTGALRSSIHVEGPERDAAGFHVRVVAGGPAAPYSLIVHEDLDVHHPVGGPKYIEGPLMESAPHLLERIARRIDLTLIG